MSQDELSADEIHNRERMKRTSSENYAAGIAKDKASGDYTPYAPPSGCSPPAEDRQGSITEWGVPVDLFSESIVPSFPLEALPHNFQVFAKEMSASSGFDAGAYGIDLLASVSGLIDHQAMLTISGSWRVPAFIWLGKVSQSGGGKTPVFKAATQFIRAIEKERLIESKIAYTKWAKDSDGIKNKDQPDKPVWKQRIINDVTIESVGALAADNPDGLTLLQDEITEFIGRMDAYSGGAGGKDRGAYMRAFEGGEHIINRRNSAPMIIDNFSVCIMGGIQPEKWGDLFKRRGGGSDGLYQRFLLYKMLPPGNVNFNADSGLYTDSAVYRIFELLNKEKNQSASLSSEASFAMQDYCNDIRTIVSRTAAKRFAEHIDKFPAFLGRITFTLHCLECAIEGRNSKEVSIETFSRALSIIRVLYRHSEAVYAIIDSIDTMTTDLVRSAGEAILSKEWRIFKRGDLTRNATHWRDADQRHAEAAIDYMIELDWLIDATPPQIPGKKGRRPDGVFLVNPAVFNLFETQINRIKRMRNERFQAIKKVAAERENKYQ
jgi:hypothetical protein